MPTGDFKRRWKAATPQVRNDLLRARFRFDLMSFARYCWPDLFDLPWNPFHRQVLGEPDPPARERRGRIIQRAIAAPRGIAKTTTAKARLVHALVYGIDRVSMVLSASQPLALQISDHIRSMFADTESPLARLFGPFDIVGGVEAWRVRLPGGRLAGLFAQSFGTQVRGTNLNGKRPTRILIDDGERPDRVRNPEQRAIWHRFLTDDVQKAGPREGGLVIEWLGTVLHPDAVLARLLVNPAWDGQKWQAMVRWPFHQDLWEQCLEIWADLTLGNVEARREAALAFYAEHQAEMDEGAEVLDPVAEPLFRLYEYIWSDGLGSFLREKQNEPRDPSAAIFDSSKFARCRVERRGAEVTIHNANGNQVRLADCRVFARWDPALGIPDGDFAAIAVLARDRERYTYVLAVLMRKVKPSLQLQSLWTLSEAWGFKRASLESNGFQAMIDDEFRRQRAEREKAGKFYQLQVDLDASTADKEERIAALEPQITNRWLQFADDIPSEVFGQFDSFPSGDHDDGPDAIEGAFVRLR